MDYEAVPTCISLSYRCSSAVFPAFVGQEVNIHVYNVEDVYVRSYDKSDEDGYIVDLYLCDVKKSFA
jgi:hypothetical protein